MGWFSSVTSVFTKVVNAVGSFFGQAFNILKEFIHRLIGLGDYFLSLLGIMPMKKIRVTVVILRNQNGPLAEEARVRARVKEVSNKIFETEAKIEIVAPMAGLVVIEPGIAPSYALEVGCGTEAWGEEFGDAGAYFRDRLAWSFAGTFLGYGEPVTAFVVLSIEPGGGCSLGPLTNYVTVEKVTETIPGQQPTGDDVSVPDTVVDTIRLRTLAHEIAHACGLWHPFWFWSGDVNNLMTKSGDGGVGTELSRWQRAIFRTSRHVTYL